MATSLLARKRRPTDTAPKKRSFRADIQGLRAVAVLAVISDHFFSWPSGGFVGVDIFFVISGFLITGLLLKEHARKGRISFPDFYRRRVRRIMPLAVLVLLVTVGAAWMLLNAGRAHVISDDALWAALFSANWHFALMGTDYMNAGAAVSPLQHFWSLAVEEQFYVLWPWLIVLVLGVWASRASWTEIRARRVLGLVMAGIVLASFGWALWETSSSPTVAYFSTFSRAWELGLGALIAIAAGVLSKLPAWSRPVLAYVGLLGIGVSLFAITPESAFPGPWAFLPVISSGLVIAAGCGGEQRFLFPLTNRLSRYFGDISYSLYLWHFPFAILVAELLPKGPISDLSLLIAVFAFSAVSFHLLEDPIRRSSWLEPKSVKRNRQPLTLNPLPYLAVLATITLAVVGWALWNDATLQKRPAVALPIPSPIAPSGGATASATSMLSVKLQAASAATEWPALNPKPEDLGPSAKAPEWVQDGCLAMERNSQPDPIANAQRCSYGPAGATKTAVLMGDSMAVSFAPGIRAALEPLGYKVVIYTMQQCPAATLTMLQDDGSAHPSCNPFRQWAIDQVKDIHPDIVFLTSSRGASGTLASRATGRAAVDEWRKGTEDTFTALNGAATRIVVLDSPPGGKNLQECMTRISKPSDCAGSADARYDDLAKATQAAGIAVNTKPAPEIVATKSWFCTADNVCPSFIGVTPVYADTGHLTAVMSKSLSGVIAETLKLGPAQG
ncbi:acyltransferase family protein [Pseudarthrobacter sp. YAF2]|uniref:acyltransferase family protein n=1 Tax=Pseudarthrobacter sp. YAF2 TaxID=3233078 RepID=UPI003F99A20E